MKVVTWQLIKGDTQTAPLLSYEDGKDLAVIHVSNAISKEAKQSEDTSHVKELVEEYTLKTKPTLTFLHGPYGGSHVVPVRHKLIRASSSGWVRSCSVCSDPRAHLATYQSA